MCKLHPPTKQHLDACLLSVGTIGRVKQLARGEPTLTLDVITAHIYIHSHKLVKYLHEIEHAGSHVFTTLTNKHKI